MNLVAKFGNIEDAESAVMLLNAHGIATHVTSRGIKSLRHFIYSDGDAALYILIDSQLEDAVKLLNDETHLVTTGLSEEEFALFNSSAKENVFESLNKAILYGIALIGLMLVIVFKSGLIK